MNETQKRGAWGEVLAARCLRKQGFTIQTANYRCRFGEIDMIASNDQYIVFAEVKTRSAGSIAQPREFVDARKQARLIKTASLYLSENQVSLQPRFDVIEVFYNETCPERSQINHLENAFDTACF